MKTSHQRPKTKDQVHILEQGEARPVGEKDQCSGLVVKKSASYHRYIFKSPPPTHGEVRPVGEKDQCSGFVVKKISHNPLQIFIEKSISHAYLVPGEESPLVKSTCFWVMVRNRSTISCVPFMHTLLPYHLLHTLTPSRLDHVLSDLLVVWSGTFSTDSTDANRRDSNHSVHC